MPAQTKEGGTTTVPRMTRQELIARLLVPDERLVVSVHRGLAQPAVERGSIPPGSRSFPRSLPPRN